MKLEFIDIKELKLALRYLRVVATKNSLTSMNHIKFDSYDGTLRLTGTNAGVKFSYTTPIPYDGEAFLIDAKYFYDLVKSVKAPFSLVVEGDTCTFDTSVRHKVDIMDAAPFPTFAPVVGTETEVVLPVRIIQDALSFVSRDHARTNLLKVAIGPDRIMGTDGHRLYRNSKGVPIPTEIYASPIVCDMMSVLSPEKTVTLIQDAKGYFTIEQGRWVIENLEDAYYVAPQDTVIKDMIRVVNSEGVICTDPDKVEEALKASEVAWKANPKKQVLLEARDGKAFLTVKDRVEYEIGTSTGSCEVGMQAPYLREAAKVFRGVELDITLQGWTAPLIFKGSVMGMPLEDTVNLLMPLKSA